MSSRRTLLIISVLLAAATVIGYAPVFRADFIDFDDGDYVQENPHVYTGLSATNVQWAFTEYHSSNWHPLTWISHMLDVELFGVDARGHHAVNLALHVVNVVLLFLLLTSLTGEMWPSAIVAALFAVHPVNVESVAWISQRKTVLSTLFGILAMGAYARYARSSRRGMYLASLVAFGLSLMSKQMLVTLPFALLLLDYWPLKRKEFEPPKKSPLSWRQVLSGWWKLFPEKLPYLALTVALSIVTVQVQHRSIRTVESYPIIARLGNVSIAYARYLISAIWPFDLAIFYPLYVDEITLPKVAAALAVLIAITALILRVGLRRRYLLVGWFWFLGTMVPVVGLVHVGLQSMADRYAYLTFWGLYIIAAWGGRDLLTWLGRSSTIRTAAAAGVAVVLLVLVGLTFSQAAKWHDTISLFEDALADTERNWQAHSVLAAHYMGEGDLQRALEHCEATIACGRDLGRVYGTYGLALFQLGSHDLAIEKFKTAVKVDPQSAWGYTNLGWANSELGHHEEAIQYLQTAAQKLTSGDTRDARRTVYANWGNTLRKLNRLVEAREKFDQALAVDPNMLDALCDAAAIDLELGEFPAAERRLKRSLAIDANHPRTRTLAMQIQLHQAAAAQEQALAANPENVEAAMQLAQIVPRLRPPAEAAPRLQELLKIIAPSKHKDAPRAVSLIHTALGGYDANTGQLDRAVEHFTKAIEVWNENLSATNNLAWILATHRDEKRRDGKRALELALRVQSLQKSPHPLSLGTLAAAYAAAGEMTKAVATAQDAMQLAKQAGDAASSAALARQLQAYQNGQPYLDR